MKDTILLLNDLPGYGKVALGGMIPVLSKMGYRIFHIPTALISNTLNYGKFEILDTTEYMKNTLQVWEELGFAYDAISTGFLANHKQAEFVVKFCEEQAKKGTILFCDPIMADNGKLYNSITRQNISDMRNLLKVADYSVPNYTEAVFLTDSEYSNHSLTEKEIYDLIDKVRKLGSKSVIITSAKVNEKDAVAGFDAESGTYFVHYYKRIDLNIPGAGDLFLAVLMGEVLKREQSLEQSVAKAADVLWKLIDKNKDSQEFFKGIMVERDLE